MHLFELALKTLDSNVSPVAVFPPVGVQLSEPPSLISEQFHTIDFLLLCLFDSSFLSLFYYIIIILLLFFDGAKALGLLLADSIALAATGCGYLSLIAVWKYYVCLFRV